MEIPILQDLLIIFSLSILVILIFDRWRVPAITGFLLTGLLAGPHALHLVKEEHIVELMAEVGVVLLLFTIGIEFSLEHLLRLKKAVLLGGGLQVGLSILGAWALASLWGFSWQQALFMGFLLSLSSTAIVLKLLQDNGGMDTLHGRTILAVLIFQDIAAIPMMLLVRPLSGIKNTSDTSWLLVMGKFMLVFLFIGLMARFLVPWLMTQVVRTRIRELFLLTIVTICIGVAWLSASVGLSLALGAFIAGLIIAESPYSHQAMGYVLPFRDIFTSLFFVSMGMLLNINIFIDYWALILGLLLLVLVLKTLVTGVAGLTLGLSLPTAALVALGLAQIGEFSLIVSKLGLNMRLISDQQYQIFLAVSILSMLLVPYAMRFSLPLADKMRALPLGVLGHNRSRQSTAPLETLSNHLLIIGFGLGGRTLAKVAQRSGIDFLVLETNLETVQKEKALGCPISYGDATQEPVLEHIQIGKARVLVVVISDPAATRRIVQTARSLNPHLHIIVRTRYAIEVSELYELGADRVISEEFETSLEIFSQVLSTYLTPHSDILSLTTEIRADAYQMLRSNPKHWGTASLEDLNLNLPEFEVFTVRLNEQSSLVGKTLAEVQLRNTFEMTLLAINRQGKVIPHPAGNTYFESGDTLVLLGQIEHMQRLSETHLLKS